MSNELFYISDLKYEQDIGLHIERIKKETGTLVSEMNARGVLNSSVTQVGYKKILESHLTEIIENLIEYSIRDLKDAGELRKENLKTLLERIETKANLLIVNHLEPDFHKRNRQFSVNPPALSDMLRKKVKNDLSREAEIKLLEAIRENTEVTPPEPVASYQGSPIGSPYGFSKGHWEEVTKRKNDSSTIYVVLGYQFKSANYDSETLKNNIRGHFESIVGTLEDIRLEFIPLAAGYGEHLFNNIALNIIGSDIAIFDTSDLNPNVMLEMGVALTWGVKVVPIKKIGCKPPPSDISGQTYLDYEESGKHFVDLDFEQKLKLIIERAVRDKTGRERT